MIVFNERINIKEFKNKGVIDLPEEKAIPHYIESSHESIEVFADINKRFSEAKKNIEKRKDIMGIFSEGVSASVDPRTYSKLEIREFVEATTANNKLEAIIDNVIRIRDKNKNAGQIIFIDKAGHNSPNLNKNLHQEIKEKLINSGKYDKSEIAIISGQQITDPKTGLEISPSGKRGIELKQAISDAYNNGDIKVVIGTTKSAGEGINVQKYTTDIYHADLPWTQAELTQRNGRGVRYGNINKQVNTHYYLQSGTFDELMYRTITNKRSWNDALWDAKTKDKIEINDDIEGVMPTEEEVMLQLERDPIKRALIEKKIEQTKLEEEYIKIKDNDIFLKSRLSSLEKSEGEAISGIKELNDKLKSDAPNKYIRELQERIVKQKDPAKRSELQSEYEQKLKGSKDHTKNMIASKEKRLEEIRTDITSTKEELKLSESDVADIEKRLNDFEEANFDEKGNLRTALDKVC